MSYLLNVNVASATLPAGGATSAQQLPDNHQVAVSNFPATQPSKKKSHARVLGKNPHTSCYLTSNVADDESVVATDDCDSVARCGRFGEEGIKSNGTRESAAHVV